MSYGSIQGQNGFLDRYGDSMAGPLNMDNNPLIGLPAPTTSDSPVRVQDLNTSLSGIEWVELYSENFPFTQTGRKVASTDYKWADWDKIQIFIQFEGGLGKASFYTSNAYKLTYYSTGTSTTVKAAIALVFPMKFNSVYANYQTLACISAGLDYGTGGNTLQYSNVNTYMWNTAAAPNNEAVIFYYSIDTVSNQTGNYTVAIYGQRNQTITA